MKLRPRPFLLALAVLCVSIAAKPPPLVFEAKERKSAVSLELGQELTVMLPTDGTDHVWQIVANDVRYLKETSQIAPLPGGPTAGATVTFQTNRGGHSRLSFVYVKPTENGETTAADTRDIAVTITRP